MNNNGCSVTDRGAAYLAGTSRSVGRGWPSKATSYPDWKLDYQSVYDKNLRSVIEKIDTLEDFHRIELINDFRCSIKDTIPCLQKNDLIALDEQLSKFCENKNFLIYILSFDNESIIAIGLGLDVFLRKRLNVI